MQLPFELMYVHKKLNLIRVKLRASKLLLLWKLREKQTFANTERDNCEVHTGKYLDRGFKVLTERKTKVQIFSRMEQTSWSTRALLFSHNQH